MTRLRQATFTWVPIGLHRLQPMQTARNLCRAQVQPSPGRAVWAERKSGPGGWSQNSHRAEIRPAKLGQRRRGVRIGRRFPSRKHSARAQRSGPEREMAATMPMNKSRDGVCVEVTPEQGEGGPGGPPPKAKNALNRFKQNLTPTAERKHEPLAQAHPVVLRRDSRASGDE
jgi:hypothetical protein